MKLHLVLGLMLLMAAGAYARGPGGGPGCRPFGPGGPGGGGQFQPGQRPPCQPGQQPPGQLGQQPPGQQPLGKADQQPPGQTTANFPTPDNLLSNSSLKLTSDQKAKIRKVRDSIVPQVKKMLTPAQLKIWRDGKYGKFTASSVLANSSDLSLTADQTAQLGKITDEAAAKAKALLTSDQANKASAAGNGDMPPGGGHGPGMPPGGGPPGGGQFGPGRPRQGN